MQGRGRPVSVYATGSTGVANSDPYNCPPTTEDTITLTVQWENQPSGNMGTAIYTASWTAPKADVSALIFF